MIVVWDMFCSDRQWWREPARENGRENKEREWVWETAWEKQSVRETISERISARDSESNSKRNIERNWAGDGERDNVRLNYALRHCRPKCIRNTKISNHTEWFMKESGIWTMIERIFGPDFWISSEKKRDCSIQPRKAFGSEFPSPGMSTSGMKNFTWKSYRSLGYKIESGIFEGTVSQAK